VRKNINSGYYRQCLTENINDLNPNDFYGLLSLGGIETSENEYDEQSIIIPEIVDNQLSINNALGFRKAKLYGPELRPSFTKEYNKLGDTAEERILKALNIYQTNPKREDDSNFQESGPFLEV
jgi:hypothetical protein